MSVARRERRGWALTLCVLVLRPLLRVLTRRSFRGEQHLPRGGFVFAANHISHSDPLLFAHFVNDAGYAPHYLAKASVLAVPVLGRFIRATGQIPVHRGGLDAAQAYRDAVKAIGRGGSVIVYPEGTITRDPDLWPMVGKTGVGPDRARDRLPGHPGAPSGVRTSCCPRTPNDRTCCPASLNQVQAGPPVDLSDLQP